MQQQRDNPPTEKKITKDNLFKSVEELLQTQELLILEISGQRVVFLHKMDEAGKKQIYWFYQDEKGVENYGLLYELEKHLTIRKNAILKVIELESLKNSGSTVDTTPSPDQKPIQIQNAGNGISTLLARVREWRKGIKLDVIDQVGKSSAGGAKSYQEVAQDIWKKDLRLTAYIQGKLQKDLPIQLGIFDKETQQLRDTEVETYSKFLDQLEQLFLQTLDYYIKILYRGSKLEANVSIKDFTEMCALDFYNTLLTLNRGNKDRFKNKITGADQKILANVIKINPFQITLLRSLFGEELSWSNIKQSLVAFGGKFERIKEVLARRISNVNALSDHFSKDENGGLSRTNIKEFVFRQAVDADFADLKASLEKRVENVRKLSDHFSKDENGGLSRHNIKEFVFRQAVDADFADLKASLETITAYGNKLLKVLSPNGSTGLILKRLNFFIFRTRVNERRDEIEKVLQEVQKVKYDDFELKLLEITQGEYKNSYRLETELCESLKISTLTFELYLIMYFNSVWGRKKLGSVANGGRDFGKSLQDTLSTSNDRSFEETVGEVDKGYERVENKSEATAISNYLKSIFGQVINSDEYSGVAEQVVDFGYDLEATKKSIENISQISESPVETWRVFVALSNQDLQEIQDILGNRFMKFVQLLK